MFSFRIPCLYIYIFPFPICKFPPLTYPSWCFPLKTAYFTAFCRQGSGQFDLFFPPCSITPCQPLRLMSKVMTDHHLLRFIHSRGLVGEAKVVTTRGRSLHHWQSCRLAHWQYLAFSIWLVFSFVRGCHTSSITGTWPGCLSSISMTGRSPLQGWILYFLQRLSQMLPGYPMWVRYGRGANGWTWYTMSHMLGLPMCITCQGTFLSSSSEQNI